MKVKVTLPENNSDITLLQFQKYEKLLKKKGLTSNEFSKRAVSIFSNLKYNDLQGVKLSDFTDIVDQITKALNTEVDFTERFFLDGVEYGFIPNLNDITTAEYVDLVEYDTKPETLNKVMAILFRRIESEDVFGNYSIINYTGTKETSQIMLQMPMNIVNGALVFFSNLSRELRIAIQKSTQKEIRRVQKLQDTLRNGVGTQQL
tara:strand:- start:923 stop:1534 length:612 start_codon:yes stop_codon:yes gene_type:complete